MFRRRKRTEEAVDEAAAGPETGTGEAEPVTEPPGPAPTTGPWDVADAPEDDTERVDLGSIRVPLPEGLELRVEVAPEGEVAAAIVVHRGSQLQISAFAAPRREAVWPGIRAEIAEALRQQGGSASETEGPFGPELQARVPSGQPGITAPARFLGSEGPRWFVRGLLTGPAATDPAQAARLEEVFRGLVVVRGKDAMAPRDSLPLRLPAEATRAPGGSAAATDDDPLNPFERGPEITEVR